MVRWIGNVFAVATLFVMATSSVGVAGQGQGGGHVICYYASWAHYRQGIAKYTVEDIPVELCTHLIYAFAILDPKTFLAKQHDPWLDRDLKNYQKFVQLKKKNPNVKVLLGLGGWNDSRSTKYSQLVADPSRRKKFVEEVLKLLLEYGFDGLDLDWEYPGYESRASDKQGFTAWLVDLKAALEPHGLLLTSAVSAGKYIIDRGYDIPKVAKLLDLIHLMSYDFHGSWEQKVAHHAPLYAEPGQDPQLCVDFAVDYWIKKGASPHKLVMGIPLYGRSWTLAGSNNSPGAAARGAGRQGRYIKASGNMGYFECCLAHQKEGWTKITGDGGPYLTNGDQWVGYDDVEAVTKKAEYAASRGLGGVLVWDTATDDFRNMCGHGHNPLLTAINNTLKSFSTSTLNTIRKEGGADGGPTNPPPTDSTTKTSLRNVQILGGGGDGSRQGRDRQEGNHRTEGHSHTIGGTQSSSGFTSPNNNIKSSTITGGGGHQSVSTTKLPYEWLAWPVFSQSPEDTQNSLSFSTHSPSISFTTSSPFSSVTSSFFSPPSSSITDSFSAPSSSSSAWFSTCRDLGFAADPASCTNFYRCTDQFAYRFTCPAGLLWNEGESACDWPTAVQCFLPLTKVDVTAFLPPKTTFTF